MKVFLVWLSEYSQGGLFGVFSSRESATEIYADKIHQILMDESIQELTLDEPLI